MNFETLRSAGNEATGNKADRNKAMMFYRNEKGEFVDASSLEGQAMASEENEKSGERQAEKERQIDAAVERDSQNVVATLKGEVGALRAYKDSLNVQLDAADQKLKNPAQYTMIDPVSGGAERIRAQGMEEKKSVEDELTKTNAEIQLLDKGAEAWLTHQYPGPEFASLIDRLEERAAKQISFYKDINDPGYKIAHTRLAGLAYIRLQIEQAQAKARPSSNG